VLWIVTDVTNGVSFWLAVTVALMATVTVRSPSACIYTEEVRLLLVTARTNTIRRVAHSLLETCSQML
jgi:hypothetical protein